MAHKTPEVLSGFTMYRSMGSRPFATVTPKLVTFSKQVVQDLAYPAYVHVFFNERGRSFAIQACEQDEDAVPFVRASATGRSKSLVRWGERAVIGPMVAMVDESLLERGSVRVIGRTYPDDQLVVFDASDVVVSPRKGS